MYLVLAPEGQSGWSSRLEAARESVWCRQAPGDCTVPFPADKNSVFLIIPILASSSSPSWESPSKVEWIYAFLVSSSSRIGFFIRKVWGFYQAHFPVKNWHVAWGTRVMLDFTLLSEWSFPCEILYFTIYDNMADLRRFLLGTVAVAGRCHSSLCYLPKFWRMTLVLTVIPVFIAAEISSGWCKCIGLSHCYYGSISLFSTGKKSRLEIEIM